MHKLLKYIFLMFVVAIGITACSDNESAQVQTADDARVMVIDVMLPNNLKISRSSASRSFSTSDYYLGDKDSIGISVENADAGKTGYARSNIKYISAGVSSSQVWSTPDVKVALAKDSAHVSAYHPFDKSINPTAIAMDCTKGIDYLYAPFKAWTTSHILSYLDPYVHLTLKHAQAVIIVKYVNDGYTGGNNKLTKFEASGTSFGSVGELNSTTGVTTNISGIYGHDMSLSPKDLPTANTDTMVVDTFYVLPTKIANGTLTFKLTIDGKDISATTNKVLEPGYIYYYPLRYKGDSKDLIIGNGVQIIPWNSDVMGNIQMIPDSLYKSLGI